MSFNKWLLQQTDHPYGPIADIADAASQDSNWPAIAGLNDMLEYLKRDESDDRELVRKSMCYAWCEYTYESSGRIIDAPRLSFICAMIASIDTEDDEDYRQHLLEDRRLFETERQYVNGNDDVKDATGKHYRRVKNLVKPKETRERVGPA